MSFSDQNSKIDHLVYGVLDLQQAVETIEQRTGLRAAEGGRHVGKGTRNYLLALSPSAYLEIIGLDDENPVAEGQTVPFALDRLDRDRLVTWAIHPDDIDGALVKSRRHGADHGKLAPMSRVDGDGNELHWTLAVADELPHDGLAPFLIDWADSPHPAASGIPQAELADLRITTPDPEKLNALFDDLRLAVRAETGPSAISATIAGPAGSIEL